MRMNRGLNLEKNSSSAHYTFMCPETFRVYYITGTGIILLASKSLLYANFVTNHARYGYV